MQILNTEMRAWFELFLYQPQRGFLFEMPCAARRREQSKFLAENYVCISNKN